MEREAVKINCGCPAKMVVANNPTSCLLESSVPNLQVKTKISAHKIINDSLAAKTLTPNSLKLKAVSQ